MCAKLYYGLKGAYSLLYTWYSVIAECSSNTCPSSAAGTLALVLLLIPSDTVPWGDLLGACVLLNS